MNLSSAYGEQSLLHVILHEIVVQHHYLNQALESSRNNLSIAGTRCLAHNLHNKVAFLILLKVALHKFQ